MVYSEREAFQKVYVERQRDVEAQWDNSRVPAYDLKEVTLQCVDVDMLRFQGKPAMLNIVLDMQFLHCFGHFKRQKNIPNHSRVLQEPWQVWIPDANVEAFKAVIHKHFKYPKDKTNNRQRRSNKPNTNPYPLTKRIHGHKLIEMLEEAEVHHVVAYMYGMKEPNLDRVADIIHSFKVGDPTCSVKYDLGYYIKARDYEMEDTKTTLLGAFNSLAANR